MCLLRFPLHRKQGPCPAAPAPPWHTGRPSLPQRRRPRALPLHSYHYPSHPSLHPASPSNMRVEKWCQPAPLGAFAGSVPSSAYPVQQSPHSSPSVRFLLKFLQAGARPRGVPQAGSLRNYRTSSKGQTLSSQEELCLPGTFLVVQ